MNKTKTKNLAARIFRFRYLYLMMLPALGYYLLFHILPLWGLVIAFQDYNLIDGLLGSTWVGIDNFKYIIESDLFLEIALTTFKISFLKLLFGFPAPIILALAINTVNRKVFKKLSQTISYLPNFLSWVIVFGLSIVIFNGNGGAVMKVYERFGLTYNDPTLNPDSIVTVLVGTHVWRSMGMGSIIYLAALSGIDPQLYEAAKVDGASKLRCLWSITMPSIMPVCAIVFILNVGSLVSGDFEQIYVFQRNNDVLLQRATDIFETYIFRNLRAMDYSTTTAMGLMQSAFACILVLLTNKGAKKMGYEGIW